MKKEEVSAYTKLKEHRGQAHRRRLKQLLKVALFGRNEGRQIALTLGELARKTRGKKTEKNTFFFQFFFPRVLRASSRRLAAICRP